MLTKIGSIWPFLSPLHSSISINFKISFKPGHFKEYICIKLDILNFLKDNLSHANMKR